MERELLYKIAVDMFTDFYLRKLASQKLARLIVDYRKIFNNK